MNKQDVAEALIKLGIPGKNKKEAIKSALVKKDSTHVEKALRKYVEKMLVRWAYTEGVIQKPERHQDKNGTTEIGRGKTSDWPDTTVEQAAAVWTLLHYKKRPRITIEMVKLVRSWVRNVYYGWAIYKIPPIMRSLEGVREIKYDEIELQFAPEGIHRPDGTDAIDDIFRKCDKKDRVTFFHDLIVKWIATIAKVRYTREQERRARKAGEYDKWPLEKEAIVVLGYRCEPVEGARDQDEKPAKGQYRQFSFLMVGGESDRGDKILLSEHNNDLTFGIDPRIYLAHSINFKAPPLSSIKRAMDEAKGG